MGALSAPGALLGGPGRRSPRASVRTLDPATTYEDALGERPVRCPVVMVAVPDYRTRIMLYVARRPFFTDIKCLA